MILRLSESLISLKEAGTGCEKARQGQEVGENP